jgi:hypothetical protein
VLVSSAVQVYNIPTSCCREGTIDEICKTAVSTGIGAQLSSVIYSEVSVCVTVSSSPMHSFRRSTKWNKISSFLASEIM